MSSERVLSWTPSAIVFDCDGTLMDTEKHWQDAREHALGGYGLIAAPGFADRAKGLHYTECGRLMAVESGHPDLTEELTGSLLRIFLELVAENPMTMPGARELVASAATFAPLAVASNCPREVVESCLDTAHLRDYFDHIVVPDAGTRPKPQPDVYLTAARRCGAERPTRSPWRTRCAASKRRREPGCAFSGSAPGRASAPRPWSISGSPRSPNRTSHAGPTRAFPDRPPAEPCRAGRCRPPTEPAASPKTGPIGGERRTLVE